LLFFFGRESLKRVEKQLLKVQADNQKVVSELERDQSNVFASDVCLFFTSLHF